MHQPTERAGRERPNKYKLFFQNLSDAVFVVDGDSGLIVDANPQGAALLGKSHNEIVGMHHTGLYPPAKANNYSKVMMKCIKEGTAIDYECEVIRNNGKVVPVMVGASAVDVGKHRSILMSFQDVGFFKEIEDALRESEERFRQLGDAAFDGIGIHDDFVLIDANQAYANTFGYELAEMIGMNGLKFVAPESRESVKLRVREGREEPYEAVCVRKDGSTFRAEICARGAHYRGRPVRVVAIRDITERKWAEENLRRAKEFSENLISSMQEGIAILDRDGFHIDVNPGLCKITGFSREELIGVGAPFPYWAPEAREKITRAFQKILRGEFDAVELPFMRKNGERFPVVVSPSSLRNDKGDVYAFFATVRDVTRFRRLWETMQFYIAQITKAQEDERQRIARDLHDETIQSLLTLCLDIETITKAGKRLPRFAVQQLEQLAGKTRRITRDLRQFTHELRPGVLDQLGLVPALQLLVDESMEGKAIEGRLSVDGPQRRLSPDVELAMFRIAQEALRNIRKHSGAGQVTINIEFGPETIKLSIIDNGRGFVCPRLMGDFVLEKKLGLAGMQERARAVGGNLSILSKVGKGTKVILEVATPK